MKKGLMNILVVSEDNTEDDKLAVRCISIADIYIYIYNPYCMANLYSISFFGIPFPVHISSIDSTDTQ